MWCGTWVRTGCEREITCEGCYCCAEHCQCLETQGDEAMKKGKHIVHGDPSSTALCQRCGGSLGGKDTFDGCHRYFPDCMETIQAQFAEFATTGRVPVWYIGPDPCESIRERVLRLGYKERSRSKKDSSLDRETIP
jgi:hypothetical protein